MIIFPAIDIKDGKVVRLRQGQFDKMTVYSDDPVAFAKKWVDEGAEWLHIIDLDGAQTGEMKNFDIIRDISHSVKVPIEVGGGIRRAEDISRLLDAGNPRVILGTSVIADRNFLTHALAKYAQAIAVSVDCVNGLVTQKGWTSVTELNGVTFAQELEQLGLKYLIYTDIKRDGMLTGPNIEALKEILQAVKISVIASGGISKLADIQQLKDLKAANLLGVITGKAIYEGTLNLQEALLLCSPNE